MENVATKSGDEIAELARRAGLEQVFRGFPTLLRAALERGLSVPEALSEARTPTTEPAHLFTAGPAS